MSRRLAAGILGFLVGGIAASVLVWNLKPALPRGGPVTRLAMGVQPAESLGGDAIGGARPSRTAMALSPDGRGLVFGGRTGDTWQLYLRSLHESRALPMAGTEGAVGPFFSPDGQWVGFWADGELKKVSLNGGPAATLCETPQVFGASWGENDVIVFAHAVGGLWSVSADGGTPEELTTLADGEVSHRLPEVLPGATAVVFTITKRIWQWEDADARERSSMPRGGFTRRAPKGSSGWIATEELNPGRRRHVGIGTRVCHPWAGGWLSTLWTAS